MDSSAELEATQQLYEQAKELFETGKQLFSPLSTAVSSSHRNKEAQNQVIQDPQTRQRQQKEGKERLERSRDLFVRILGTESDDEEVLKLKETALYRLGDIYAKLGYVLQPLLPKKSVSSLIVDLVCCFLQTCGCFGFLTQRK